MTQELLADFGRAILATGLLASAVWCAWCLAVATAHRACAATRACAAAVILLWLAVATFLLLSSVHAFHTLPVIGLAVAAGAVGHRVARRTTDPGTLAAQDLATLRTIRLGTWEIVAIALGGLVLAARFLRGWLAPPLAWDDLTYHLVRAGRWVQAGGYHLEAAPHAWGYHEYFAPVGDVLSAWAMLPTRSDALLVLANALVLSIIALGIYAGARRLGSNESTAMLASAFVLLAPPVAGYLPSAYVDTLSLALFALSVVLVDRIASERCAWAGVLACGVFGLAVGVKISNLAFALPGTLLVLALVARLPGGWRRRSVTAARCLLAGLISAPFFIKAWLDHGSPTYPIPVEIAGRELFAGNPWQRAIFAQPVPGLEDSLAHVFRTLFVPNAADFTERGQFLNLGPAVLLLLVPAVAGVARLLRATRWRVTGWYLILASVCVVASVLLDSFTNLRTFFGWSLGRFLLVPMAATVLCAAVAEGRGKVWLLRLGVIVNALLAIPWGWSRTDLVALGRFSLAPLPILAAGALLTVLLARRSRRGATAVAVLAICAAVAASIPVRASYRYDYFRDASRARAYTINRDVAAFTGGWRLWQRLDRPASSTLAVTAGWAGMSHVGARYPLLGGRLQNRVLYVPITESGRIVDRPDGYSRLSAGSFETWLRRLVEADVDYLVALPPPSVESVWALRHPQIFTVDPVSDPRTGLLYRLDRDLAETLLQRTP